MTFKIKPFAGQTYAGHYADHHDIRAYLGLGQIVQRQWGNGETYETVESKKMPVDFAGETTVPLTDGRTTRLFAVEGQQSPNGWRGKSSAHRCYAVCPDCGTHVPAGRTHQHKCK
jgi:hypothetical protein